MYWRLIDHSVPTGKGIKNDGSYDKIRQNLKKIEFLGRFGTVRPKFWALTFFQAFLLSQQLNTMELSSNMQNQQNLM